MKALLPFAGLFVLGCGPASVSIPSLFPADGQSGGGTAPQVSNYVAATGGLRTNQKQGLNVAQGRTEIEKLIDGDADLYLQKDVVALGWEVYTSDMSGKTYQADVRLWQMKDSAKAVETWDYLLTASNGLHKAQSWTDLSVGAAGRIANTGGSYWVNTRKGVYIVDVIVSTTPVDDMAKEDAKTFATTMTSKMP